jgi:hypothetical protein
MQGTITCVSDGKNVTFKTEKTAQQPTNPTSPIPSPTPTPTPTSTPKPTPTPTPTPTSTPTPTPTPPPTQTPESGYYTYIGNENSHVFHVDTCSVLPLEKYRQYFGNRLEAITAGFTPCKVCKP